VKFASICNLVNDRQSCLLHKRVIEANLDSITKTPRINRDELLSHVHIPELLNIKYFQEHLGPRSWSSTLASLLRHVENTGNQWQKHNLHLLPTTEIAKLSTFSITERKWSTSGQKQLTKLCARAQHLQQELGPWASSYYITATTARVTSSMHLQQNAYLSRKDEERIHILNTLGQVRVAEPDSFESLQKPSSISKKCTTLLEVLTKTYNKDFRGLIFVEQRVTAAVLCRLLSEHPQTKQIFMCGTFVGTSTNESRTTELGDLLDQVDQKNTLKDFREGNKNLIIATSALEEGIDISACNVVVCFNKPPNLKSFIQRRGRARHEKSTFVLLSASDDDTDLSASWETLESEMVREYMRESRELIEEDGIIFDEMKNDSRIFRVESTW
jgi:ERCC4-related helicase